MENTFKSSVFGGFNRDDVTRYIEKTALESKQQIEALEKESDELCRENASLRDELAAAKEAHDKASASYSAALEVQVDLKKQVADAQRELAVLRAEKEKNEQKLAALQREYERAVAEGQREREEKLAAAERENAQLRRELDELRPQSEEYARMKAHIAELELSARERADALEAETRARLQELIGACSAQCELVIATLGTTCANVSGELRRTDAMVSQLPAAFNTLRTDLKELNRIQE